MIQRCQHLIGGVLAFIVLLVLHLIHGSTLLLALFLHLINHIQLSTSTTSRNESISNDDAITTTSYKTLLKDSQVWKQNNKIPNCLGIIFVPTARGYFSLSKLRYTAWSKEVILQGMIEDVIKIVSWSKALGIDNLLLYDENGEQHETIAFVCHSA